MYKQPMPPMLEALIKQVEDARQPEQFRKNAADRLEDIREEIDVALSKFKVKRVAAKAR